MTTGFTINAEFIVALQAKHGIGKAFYVKRLMTSTNAEAACQMLLLELDAFYKHKVQTLHEQGFLDDECASIFLAEKLHSLLASAEIMHIPQ